MVSLGVATPTKSADLFPPETRADQIFERFTTFHNDNPGVWRLFKRFTFELIEAGRTRYSVDAIFNRIRWHVEIETRGEAVKINNDFTAYYARMFMATYPQHAGFFELRKRRSAEHPAYADDMATFNVGPANGESVLMEQLRRLGSE